MSGLREGTANPFTGIGLVWASTLRILGNVHTSLMNWAGVYCRRQRDHRNSGFKLEEVEPSRPWGDCTCKWATGGLTISMTHSDRRKDVE